MSALRRQQLVRLSGAGWTRVLEAPWDPVARSCVAAWAARGLPLVVTRQPESHDGRVAAGLPAPARYGRLRLAVDVDSNDVTSFEEFPLAEAVTPLLPRSAAPAWRTLLAALADAGCAPRVYGGFGWQSLTRMAYVHADSDLDLLLPVDSAARADATAQVLAEAAWNGPRLDGELLLPDGGAVAWREWRAHRQGHAARVLVKRLHGVALECPA